MRRNKKDLEEDEDEDEYDDDDDYDDEDDDDDYDDKHSRRGGRRRGGSNAKKIVVVFIVLIILVLALYAIFMLNPSVQSIYIEQPIELNDGSGIEIKAHIALEGSGTANGEGDLKIKYDNETVYSSKITISNDFARKSVPFTDFVIGNDQYQIEITYEGKTEYTIFEVDDSFGWNVAEKLEIISSLDKTEKADDIRIRVISQISPLPKEADLQVTIKHEDSTPKTFNKTITYKEISFELSKYDYLSTGNGNYTINAELTNLHVKKDSEFYKIEIEEPEEIFLNIDPVADAGSDQVVIIPPLGDGMLNVDGSNSWNDGDLEYEWDFDYKDEDQDDYDTPDFTIDETGVTAQWEYTEVGSYDVALRVTGIDAEYHIWNNVTKKYDDSKWYPEQDITSIKVNVRRA